MMKRKYYWTNYLKENKILKQNSTLSIFLYFFISIANPLSAQSNQSIAKEQLNQMKGSFILVRLKTDSLKIAALEKNGFIEEAEKQKQQLYLENKETILSFAKTFDFCPVYFFYSSSTDNIRSGKIEGHVFDSNLKMVDGELLKTQPFFTAKFGKTENLGIHALILMDHYFVPLKSPFPFYQRQYVFFSLFKQGKGTIAKRLNKKLKEQYEVWNDPEWGF